MRVTIKGLRHWIVSAGALLLVVVAGFFIYGRTRFRHIEKDLPSRLGANIQQTATGFSYSQSSQGHTLFTLKASKLVELKAGHALLHDVDITLYGPPGSGRTDRIYGSDFDYDQNNGTATSRGEVEIEIQGMGSPPPQQSNSQSESTTTEGTAAEASGSQSSTIRVRTSGLTFVQKTGDASTAQPVQFQLPRAAGSSVGASFNSRSGILVLDSDVHITTSTNGKSAVVTAQHATLLRARMQALLDGATMDYQTARGSSDHATLWLRKDGTTEKIDADGHVQMASDSGATVRSQTAHILLDPKSQPTRADLSGGVQFVSRRDTESMHGSAAAGTLLFTADPADPSHTELHHAQFRQQVSFVQQIQGLARDPQGQAEKQLQAQKVDIDFAPAGHRHAGEHAQVEARTAWADGSPVLITTEIPSKGPQQSTHISGDHLVASFGPGNALEKLDGSGNTRVLQESSDGARDTTRGDVLHVTFGEQPASAGKASPQRASGKPGKTSKRSGSESRGQQHPPQTVLETAVQDGNVMLTETPARKPGESTQPATLNAWAQHAEYRAADQVLHLTGHPRMTDSESMQLSAEMIDYHRDTQDASASGTVKATYTQQPKAAGATASGAAPTMGGSGPVHIIAERAALHHASSQSDFYGSTQAPARMWQDADLLMAPVIEIDRAKGLLKAHGAEDGNAPVVSANFTSALGANHQQTVIRVHSQTLAYSDKDRRGDFHGAVTAEQGSDVIHCDDALVFLKPAPPPAQSARPASAAPETARAKPQNPQGESSRIDRMVATGHVVFTQPGRRGEGTRLVYTAGTGDYVLTGTSGDPPRMTDRVHGTTTGEALLFNSQNDSVEVSGGKSSAVTDTRVPK